MIKAYIKGGTITVVSGKKSVEYPVGAGATSLGGKWDFDNPYAYFQDYSEQEMAKLAASELAKLIALPVFSMDTLGEFDSARKNKLYFSKSFTISYELKDSVLPCFTLASSKELFALEILTAAMANRPLKVCENCGGYFFPSGRADSVYCDRIQEGGYSCKKIGAHRQYRRNSRANDLKKLYDKVTKHNRYLKAKGTMSAYEYKNWMATASQKFADYKEEKISPAEFEAWLLGKEEAPVPRARTRNTISDYLL